MAMKYMLIPEDMYNEFIREHGKKEGEISLDLFKKDLNKTKKVKDVSAKNVLYNQELRRYLKYKKEVDEKPVKVDLSNGAKMLMKKQQPGIVARPLEKGTTERSMHGVILNGDSEDAFTINEPKSSDYETVDETPRTSRVKRVNRRSTRKNVKKDNSIEKLLNIIRSDPTKFNVNRDGTISSYTNIPIEGSNYVESVKRILDRNIGNAPSPKGTNILLSKIRKYPETNEIFEDRVNSDQSGGGLIKSRTHFINKKRKTLYSKKPKLFTPSLWR
jgi:hypothetical protein